LSLAERVRVVWLLRRPLVSVSIAAVDCPLAVAWRRPKRNWSRAVG
jgi:hypothetical protein